ncbi:SF3a splicing factor complex subunit [Coniosporium apollinis]|uniref:SF3a splicing factor complex subunit n=2 Tax=Coniosporium TaxID=2810619 RepID=A0ABQ9P0J6_9PEZI|nr:SF3a splicing factor complex subunit [Cladosporium sp. JES 115]KAJ9665917.1 SF3a splicing factor complex subunit [Coniosporium apollinis]
MAPAAIIDTPMTSLDEAHKPPPNVVLPPKDIRSIVEKTAGYVARNGSAFEERIRAKEQSNPKFCFLNPSDAYSPFYLWRLSEIREGRGTAVSAGRAEEAAREEEQPQGPEEPPEFHFSARMPIMNAQDLEVVKLTALFVAKNGRSFMTALSQRETGNYQFDFLRPQHSMYQFFSRLVDQYTELLNGGSIDGGRPERERLAQLERNVHDRFHMLERARRRAEWVKYQEQQKAKQEEEAEAEKIAYAQIDWHDFVVVETVVFNEADDQTDLPPPTSLNDLQSASLEQKAMMSLQPHNMRIEEAMPTDEPSYYDQAPQPVQMPAPQTAYAPPPIHPSRMDYVMQQSAQDDEEERLIRERTEARERAQQAQAAAKGGTGPMRIRNDYVPRAQAKRQNVNMALCPNCNQQVPYDELEQHMKVELLDPEWRKQKAKSDARYATTNLSTADVANNLKRLASQRSDVFDGVTGLPVSEEEAARRKKAATSYDGNPQPADTHRMQSLNIEEQIRQIKEKYGGQ